MDLLDLVCKITIDPSDYERGINEAREKTSSFGETVSNVAGKIGSGLITAFKAATVAIGAASTAVGALTKMSIEGYGEYEQLVGGVETLFGESSDFLMSYANNAYKTAGLSANKYMETVTSFSASLLQSLEGDTYDAAEVANMAITDMADNANKMGTAMDSIQNAYQGFAKQNFTMLDNLKLGYGGTKEEMQRLLKDAEKLSGIKYDISSFADIADAIHVVQTEIGITGTTAKEAATTIQGSVASAKSAWQNLVTGIADENADLDTLIGNFVDSVATAGENIIPRVEQILTGMGAAIQKLAPIISEQIPPLISTVLPSMISAGGQLLSGLLTGIISALPEIAGAAPQIFEAITTSFSENWPTIQASGAQLLDMLWQGLTENLSTVTETAVEIIASLANGISEQLPTLVPVAVEAVLTLAETLTDPDSLNNMVDSAIALIESLADGIINALPTLIAKAPIIIANLVSAIVRNVPKLLEAAVQIVAKLATGIIDNLPQIGKAAGEIVTTVVSGIFKYDQKILEVGVNIVKGIWSGITSMGSWLTSKVTGFFGGLVDGIKNTLGIHSPSTVFAKIGEYSMQGLAVGMKNSSGKVMETVEDVTNEVKSRLDDFLGDVEHAMFLAEKNGSAAAADMIDGYRLMQQKVHEMAEYYRSLNYAETSDEIQSLQKMWLNYADDISAAQAEAANAVINGIKAQYDNISSFIGLKSEVGSLEYQLWERTEGKNVSDIDKYIKKLEYLSVEQEDQEVKVSAAEEAYNAIVEQYGAASEESYKYQKQLYQEKLALQDIVDQIEKVNAARDELQRQKLSRDLEIRRIEFEHSALGVASAAAINGANVNPYDVAMQANINVVLPDGTVLAKAVAPSLVAYMDSNGTPIVNK